MLKLHRLIHPSDFADIGPKPGKKKPYLLLHGLIGSSASFLRNVNLNYLATPAFFDSSEKFDEILRFRLNEYEHGWQSVADKYAASHENDRSAEKRSRNSKYPPRYSILEDIDYDGDSMNFGREFKQAYRKFQLPASAKSFITNSLAFTLSNFGYDVWLINLRGNSYSREFNGPLKPQHVEYWNFNIDKLINEDLLASLNKVRQITEWPRDEPMGLVSYSYTGLHVLGLLTKYPLQQKSLQPIVMIAPTLLSSAHQSTRYKYFMKIVTKTLVANNGPFPTLARSKNDKIERLVCSLPVASSLCRLLESLLYGRTKSFKLPNLIVNDQETWLIKRDGECGQTSTAVLHQIIDILMSANIDPKYVPFVQARNMLARGEKLRRSIMVIHSEADRISSPVDVEKIKNRALKFMTLLDVNIKEPQFDHTDFLFSKKNQYLVNGEIARMVTVFDFLLKRPSANMPMQQTRGY